jgi:flagellar M-ring protein FliF
MRDAVPASSARQFRVAAIVLVAVVGLLGAAYYWFLTGDYAVLARGVRPEQAAAMVDELKKDNVAYELRDGGTTILVPTGKFDAARLDVSSGDLPAKGTVGFELFNQSDMGLTDFAQKVNYQRALQGEIARTIMAMDGIAYARVHLALPERSLFRTTTSEPRAAVTLTPQPGVEIDSDRIAGIQRLVAATIPDLAIDQVAILNERGQLLTPEFSDVPAAASSQSAIENNYGDRVARAVASVAPRAHVQVKVTVMPRAPGASADASGRDHSIRVVLFERSPLVMPDEQLVRSAVTSELQLQPALGDQLLFSPAPEIAAQGPANMAIGAVPVPDPSARAAAEDQLMAKINRSWTIVLSLLAVAALLAIAIRFDRSRRQRRQQLVNRIREQLLLVEGAANAA